MVATWNAINHFYWGPVYKFLHDNGFKNAVTYGQLYDTNLNAGEFMVIVKKITEPVPSKGGKEEEWLKQYSPLWAQYIKSHHSIDAVHLDRQNMWQSIYGNCSLTLPITVTCYGDKYTITGPK